MTLFQEIAMFEGHAPQLVDLTLREVVASGGATNPYQIFVLGLLSSFFKDGLKSAKFELETPIPFNNDATTVARRAQIEALGGPSQAQLAQYLLDCLAAGESAVCAPDMDVVDWMKFVLRRQD